jgi:uncharacterized cupredoxin-like copper-binding protein
MRRLTAAAVALAVLAACGPGGGSGTAADDPSARTIEVEMRDIAFAPTAVEVRTGEKVRFVFRNTGQVVHDAFIGDLAAQEAHEREMREGKAHDHGKDPTAVSVRPGRSGSITYTFSQPGQLLIGCHQPGHYIGGMKAQVTIA